MEISGFAEIVRDNVAQRLGSGYHVTVRKTGKNNGVIYTGLDVKKDDLTISPLIYLDDHFKKYENGDITLHEVANYVTSVSKRENPSVDVKKFLNYESVSKSIVYKLVNTERNSELLEDIPHIEFLDLSIVFQCMLVNDKHETASILVHNAHRKLWDVTTDELFKAAGENTPKLMGYEFKSMREAFCEIMNTETQKDLDYDAFMEGIEADVPMYVLSNKYRVNGGACILYPTLLSDICNRLESSFYILPSSIHEVLVLPVDNTDRNAEIKAMIREINNTQVAPEEILSYSLYYYDRDEYRLYIV